jgi:hypothetical protein
MPQTTDGTATPRLGRILASFSTSRACTLLYYLAVLLGLVVLYGRGDFSTAGFIYQAF